MRRTVPVLCGGVLLALLAGCGQSSLHSGSDDPRPATATRHAAPHPVGTPTTALLSRVQRALDGRRSVRFAMSLGHTTVRGTVTFGAGASGVRSALGGRAGEFIAVGGDEYLTSPRIVAERLGTPWARIAAGGSAPYDSPGGLLRRSTQAAPAAVLAQLRAAGTLTGGTDPYAFRLDPRRLASTDPLHALSGAAARTDLRLDASGLPQRVRTTVELPGRRLVTTISYAGWDAPAHVARPAANRVGSPTGA